MTKGTTVAPEKQPIDEAPTAVFIQPPPVSPQPGALPMYYNGPGVNHSSATVMYVLSILATFFCIPVCSIIGLVHAMIAKHEGERGNILSHQRRLYQAKCWTGWSIALGLVCWIFCFVVLGLTISWYGYGYSGYYGDDIVYPSSTMYPPYYEEDVIVN